MVSVGQKAGQLYGSCESVLKVTGLGDIPFLIWLPAAQSFFI